MKVNLLHLSLLIFLSAVCPTSAEQGTAAEAARTYQTGLQALARKDDRAALIAFQQAVKLDASHAEAHYQLSVLYGKLSQWKPAIHALPDCDQTRA